MTFSLQPAAEWYASHGWPVFPCVPGGKRPLTARGFRDASTDLKTIRVWWAEYPDANIGLSTGEAGLVVIDCDVKGGAPGLDSWRELRTELDLPDSTPTCETPSGGLHVYYRANGHPIGCSVGRLAAGLDVRAQGGYVIAPPVERPRESTAGRWG